MAGSAPPVTLYNRSNAHIPPPPSERHLLRYASNQTRASSPLTAVPVLQITCGLPKAIIRVPSSKQAAPRLRRCRHLRGVAATSHCV